MGNEVLMDNTMIKYSIVSDLDFDITSNACQVKYRDNLSYLVLFHIG